MARAPLVLKASLKSSLERLAEASGVSMNEYCGAVLEEACRKRSLAEGGKTHRGQDEHNEKGGA